MPIRCLLVDARVVEPGQTGGEVLADLASQRTVGMVHPVGSAEGLAHPLDDLASRPAGAVAFELPLAAIGLSDDDPTVAVVAAAAARCFPRELAVVTGPASALADAAEAAGAQVVVVDEPARLADVGAHLVDLEADEQRQRGTVGVGPHPAPWPTGAHLDPVLLERGDRRNVIDRYRYWTEAAIVADLDRHRQPLHVAVENWQHDLNIGTVVRNANAFNVSGVHIIGKRRWNRRGAMATDRYLTVHHHASLDSFATWAADEDLSIVGVDNVPGAVRLAGSQLPQRAVLLFGQEGPGLSAAAVERCDVVCEIPQFGSTRSLNAGVASGVAMYVWTSEHGGIDRLG